MPGQRLRSGGGRRVRVIRPGLWIQDQHRFAGIVEADAGKFRLVRHFRTDAAKCGQNPADAHEQRQRQLPEAGFAAQLGEQHLALLSRRDRIAWPANRQDTVPAVFIVEAIGKIAAKIAIADRLARGQAAIAEDEERLSPLYAPNLPGQRFEEGGGAHDGIGQAGVDQFLLEGKLGLLKGQKRLLHADRRQQHHVRNARLFRGSQGIDMGLMIDLPGIAGPAGSRGEAGDQHVERLASETVARNRAGIRHIAIAQAGARQHLPDGIGPQLTVCPGPRTHETDHLMAPVNERVHRRPADGSGRAQHQHAARARGSRLRGWKKRRWCGHEQPGR